MLKNKNGLSLLTIGALGVVFGDIGTSPLYALPAVFSGRRHLSINADNIYGVVSLILWSITIAVTIKFIGFLMRADNNGEGGILALVSHIKSAHLIKRYKHLFIMIGIIGVSMFYGDAVITPAISILSAVEGLKIATPSLASYVLPITLAIITCLFWLQKYGTGLISSLFGPIMLIWFLVVGIGGLNQIVHYPAVVKSLSPLVAGHFIFIHPALAFIALAAVILTITGAEALYADLGHFGRPAIARAWLLIVFPALALCYMGQAAMILHNPSFVNNALVQLYPSAIRLPVVFLATLATIIASQAVIAGAFSITKQAVQLDFLPRLMIRHTSDQKPGRVYLPFINWLMLVLVVGLVIGFGSSAKLAGAYGIAVSGTLAADTILFLVVAKQLWHKSKLWLTLVGLLLLPLDLSFVFGTLPKIAHGGLFPIVVGAVIFLLIDTWTKGNSIVEQERQTIEGPLSDFVDQLRRDHTIDRAPGAAIYIGHHAEFVPLALKASVEELHELPAQVIIVTVRHTAKAHVAENDRLLIDDQSEDVGIIHISLLYGYHDRVHIPEELQRLERIKPELNFKVNEVAYIISQMKVVLTKRHNMASWRKGLYNLMARNAVSTSDYYRLPIERTEEISSLIRL